MTNNRIARGFTLIELMVAMAIIGIMLALLLPKVLQTRLAAQRAQCQNNLRQIGLALHSYHDVHKVFPPGSSYFDTSKDKQAVGTHLGWAVAILPYVEQQALSNVIQTDVNLRTPAVWNAFTPIFRQIPNVPNYWAETVLPIYMCPSDSKEGRCDPIWAVSKVERLDTRVGKSNYLGVQEAQSLRVVVATTPRHLPGIFQAAHDPAGRLAGPTRISDVSDGTSNTVIVGERESQLAHFAGIWAGTEMSESYTEPTVTWTPHLGRIMNCKPSRGTYRDPQYLLNGLSREAYSSLHAGGVQFAYADGHVQFLSENVDEYVLIALATIAEGEDVELPRP